MAMKMKPGQKRCPSCGTVVKGPRTKTCPKCGREFNGKPQEVPAPEAAPAVVEQPAKNGGTVTVDRTQVSKSQAVRDYLKDHPKAMPVEIAAALPSKVSRSRRIYVSAIKTKAQEDRHCEKGGEESGGSREQYRQLSRNRRRTATRSPWSRSGRLPKRSRRLAASIA